MIPNTLLGGIGLNIQHASIVIQTEPWWNHSVEMQAVARCHRQNQTRQVKQLLLVAPNSAIDREVLAVRGRKVRVNNTLMEPLIRRHDEPIKFMDLLSYPALPVQTYEEHKAQDVSDSEE
jgi:SNF2 family DNA or RNA helicase